MVDVVTELDARRREAAGAHRELLAVVRASDDVDEIVLAARRSVESKQLIDAIDLAEHEIRIQTAGRDLAAFI